MCEYSGRLVAWLDRELPEEEATNVQWHVGQCAECRKAVSAYEKVSNAFLICYQAAQAAGAPRKPRHWRPFIGVAVAGGAVAAAATLLLFVLSRPQVEQLPVHPLPTVHAPEMAFQRPSAPLRAVHTRRAAAPSQARQQRWLVQEPTIEVALPADALFPPGAVPEGFSFIADVRP
jgi:hypothetical protein